MKNPTPAKSRIIHIHDPSGKLILKIESLLLTVKVAYAKDMIYKLETNTMFDQGQYKLTIGPERTLKVSPEDIWTLSL